MSHSNSKSLGRRGFLQAGVPGTVASTPAMSRPARGDGPADVPEGRPKDRWMSGKPTALIFDVNEALIDFDVMHFLRIADT